MVRTTLGMVSWVYTASLSVRISLVGIDQPGLCALVHTGLPDTDCLLSDLTNCFFPDGRRPVDLQTRPPFRYHGVLTLR